MPEFKISEHMLRAVVHGNPIQLNSLEHVKDIETSAGIRIISPYGDLLAIGSYSNLKNEIKMDVVFT